MLTHKTKQQLKRELTQVAVKAMNEHLERHRQSPEVVHPFRTARTQSVNDNSFFVVAGGHYFLIKVTESVG